ncbi:MAG: ATPase, T2SS/T4P/T4SS family [Candidatus Binataceae bacterium]
MVFSNHPIVDEHAGVFLPIAHLITDKQNNEIVIDNGGKVYTDRGNGALHFAGIVIPELQLRAAIRMLVAASGAYIDPEYAAHSLTLACGARFFGSLPPFGNEPQVCIRLHSGMGRPVSSFMTALQERLVNEAIRGRRSIVIGGAVSTGKSTLLNALVNLIPHGIRILLIEDVYELQPAADQLVVRRLAQGRASLKAHVKEALRNRPDWIIIGETRDASAWDLMDAARTGHPMLSTVHASSGQGILTRLMSLASCNQEFVNEALDLVLFVERFEDGSRRVTEILAKQKDQSWADVTHAQ